MSSVENSGKNHNNSISNIKHASSSSVIAKQFRKPGYETNSKNFVHEELIQYEFSYFIL